MLRAKHFGSRVFFSAWRQVRPIQDGERGERVTNTLSGAKHGGHHHQERALVLTSLCRTKLSIKVPHPNEIQNPDRARFDTKVPSKVDSLSTCEGNLFYVRSLRRYVPCRIFGFFMVKNFNRFLKP